MTDRDRPIEIASAAHFNAHVRNLGSDTRWSDLPERERIARLGYMRAAIAAIEAAGYRIEKVTP